MQLFKRVLQKVSRPLSPEKAHAHCDIPCGIYDPHLAQLAALTVVRMNQLIGELPKPDAQTAAEEVEAHDAKLSRYIATKEHHAELCKQELRILWGDYFTPQHLQQHPELHDLFWNAMKQASRARQGVDMDAAQQLLSTTHQIAEIFWKTKGAETRKQPSRHTVGGELVYPMA